MGYHDQPRPPRWGDPAHRAAPSATMRVSDAERNEITNALCRHFGDGRLDEEELNERLAKATAAKTQADLAPLLEDLPPLESMMPTPDTRPRPRPPHPPRILAWVVIGWLAVMAFGWTLVGVVGPFRHPHVPLFFLAVLAFVILRRRRWHGRRYGHHDRL